MEVTGVVKDGRIELPATVKLPEGAHVRVILDAPAVADAAYEREPVSEESVEADLAWATGKRFGR